jgi:hypothetical protein
MNHAEKSDAVESKDIRKMTLTGQFMSGCFEAAPRVAQLLRADESGFLPGCHPAVTELIQTSSHGI